MRKSSLTAGLLAAGLAIISCADGSSQELASKKAKPACLTEKPINCQGMDLSGANLSEARLWWADLTGADLEQANLRWAELRGAELSLAHLNRADLSEANLRGADLSLADLSLAHLNRADLSGADLRGADLGGADLSDVTWSDDTICPDLQRADPKDGCKGHY